MLALEIAGASVALAGDGGSTYGLGSAFSSESDFNGDGHNDLAVGADGARAYGRVFVYMGSATGLSGVAALEFGDSTSSGCFGRALDGGGDVNGDGYDDVAVGGQSETFVYFGTSAGLSPLSPTALAGRNPTRVGDLDSDGYDDVAVGSLQEGAWVFAGSSAGLRPTASVTVTGVPSSRFGEVVDGAGDIDGDGDHRRRRTLHPV